MDRCDLVAGRLPAPFLVLNAGIEQFISIRMIEMFFADGILPELQRLQEPHVPGKSLQKNCRALSENSWNLRLCL